MKLRLLDLLVCPIDKTPLELVKWEVVSIQLSKENADRAKRLGLDPASCSTEIVTGVLLNRARRVFYPIYKGIPRMLVFPTSVSRDFAKQHASRIASELPGFALPTEEPMPGEETVLRTFSGEWVNYDWDEGTYWSQHPDAMYDTMKFLLDLERKPVKDRLVLEVGIGIGGIADYMARKQECELVGVDLSYAVDPAYKHFGSNPFFHIVQSSAFKPPFPNSTFDFVYSHGVIHHTFSTKTAFEGISNLPKPGGRLYIWVYSHHDEERTLERRVLMKMERLLRPLIWRLPNRSQTVALLPILPLYLIRQNLLRHDANAGYIKYGLREALHAARDRFTPRYIHRHTDEEVCAWFAEAGYKDLQCVSQREHPPSVPIPYVMATAVDGTRHSA
jgi:uncharacterized protein YbaR (Trm112 family)/SAM-dependent methyltransferase